MFDHSIVYLEVDDNEHIKYTVIEARKNTIPMLTSYLTSL